MLKALKAYPNVLEYTMFLHFILQGNWPAKYRAHQQPRGCSPLDPNHSHFILVDNGTQHKFGTEIEFRAKFEQAACRLKSTTGIFTQDGPFLPCTTITALCPFLLSSLSCFLRHDYSVRLCRAGGRTRNVENCEERNRQWHSGRHR